MYTNCATQSIYIPEHEGCSDCEVLEQDVEELKGQMADVQETLPEKQDKLTAGEGIFITPDNIISSTSGTFVVTFSNGTADKTISQIINAFDNNMTILGSDGDSYIPLEDVDKVNSRAVFLKIDDTGSWETYTIESDNTVTYDTGAFGGGIRHLVDGVADGSARSTTSTPESGNYALGYGAIAVGDGTSASGPGAFAEGSGTVATGNSAHAEGYGSASTSYSSHAEGTRTEASNTNAHAEGGSTKARGVCSHAEGAETYATGNYSHAEGYDTVATTNQAHAEGNHTTASGNSSHSEGYNTTASNEQAHAEGYSSSASGKRSHAGGYQSVASGTNSFAHGDHVTAQGADQTVIGSLNVTDTNNEYAFIIGNGNHGGGGSASNAFGVKWDGTLVFANGTTITPAQFANLASLVNAYGQNF